MPTYEITVVNEEFSSSNEHECADQQVARKHAIASALAIGAEQVAAGKPFFGAEVTLQEGNKLLGRFVIAIGASPLNADG